MALVPLRLTQRVTSGLWLSWAVPLNAPFLGNLPRSKLSLKFHSCLKKCFLWLQCFQEALVTAWTGEWPFPRLTVRQLKRNGIFQRFLSWIPADSGVTQEARVSFGEISKSRLVWLVGFNVPLDLNWALQLTSYDIFCSKPPCKLTRVFEPLCSSEWRGLLQKHGQRGTSPTSTGFNSRLISLSFWWLCISAL